MKKGDIFLTMEGRPFSAEKETIRLFIHKEVLEKISEMDNVSILGEVVSPFWGISSALMNLPACYKDMEYRHKAFEMKGNRSFLAEARNILQNAKKSIEEALARKRVHPYKILDI